MAAVRIDDDEREQDRMTDDAVGSVYPRVAVVVPVFNDLLRLRLCVEALAAQDYPGRFEVIIADNASTVDLSSALPPGDPRFRMVFEAKRGSYAARNAGLAVVDAGVEVVAFTDADCRPHADWLRKAVDRLGADDLPDAIGGRIRLVFRDGPAPHSGPELYEYAHDFNQKFYIEHARFAATANLVTTKRALERVGDFNSDLQSGGDDDWGHRLHDADGTLVYCDEAIIDHPSRASWGELTQKAIRVARGIAALTSGQALREDLRFYREELVSAARVVVTVWRREWPETTRSKVRYAAAYAWVTLIHVSVRLGDRLNPRRLLSRT